MNRKKIILIAALATVMCLSLVFAACNGNETYSVTIANKQELLSEWYEGGADRTVKVDLPDGVDSYKVTSSNSSVVTVVDNSTLRAIGAGTARITVTSGDETDSVKITVRSANEGVSIVNKSALQRWVLEDEPRTLRYSVKPASLLSNGMTIESSNEQVVSVDGAALTAKSYGTATVTIKVGVLTDSVQIEVIHVEAPVITLVGSNEIETLTNTETELPVSVTSCDGKDLRASVSADCPGGVSFNSDRLTVSVAQKGSSVLKLQASDPRDESKKSNTVEITVNAYRNPVYLTNGWDMYNMEPFYESGAKFAEDSKQVLFFDRTDAMFAQFDMRPSKIYYAEAVFEADAKTADWSTYYGMTHSVKGDVNRWLTSYVDRGAAETRDTDEPAAVKTGARNFMIKDVDLVNDRDCWTLGPYSNPLTPVYWQDRIYDYRQIDDGGDPFPVKLAVARIGDFFYSFVNDCYVMGCTNKYYSDKDTVAGLFQQSNLKTDVKSIVWLTDGEAQAKFDELTEGGNKIISSYVPNEWYKQQGSQNTDNRHFVTGESSVENGVNFDFVGSVGFNAGIVSPQIIFDSDFTFEWEYSFDPSTDNAGSSWGNQYQMLLEVRNYKLSGEQCVKFGVTAIKNGSDNVLAFATRYGEEGELPDMGGTWYTDITAKYSFKITRQCTQKDGKHVAKYTFSVTSDKEPSKILSHSWECTGTKDWDNPCMPANLMWHNANVKGKYTNVKWQASVDVDAAEA